MGIFGIMNYNEDIMISKSAGNRCIVWRRFVARTDWLIIAALLIGVPTGVVFSTYVRDMSMSATVQRLPSAILVAVVLIIVFFVLKIVLYFQKSTMHIIFDHEKNVLRTNDVEVEFSNIAGLRIISWSTTGKRKKYGKRELCLQLQTENGENEIALFYNPHFKPKRMKYWRNIAYSMGVIFQSELERELDINKASTRTTKPSNVV